MTWWRIALAALLSLPAVGCARTAPAKPPETRSQSPLATARALRQRAEALHAPVYTGPDRKTDQGAFLAGPLRRWVVQRMQLHRRALAAYRDAAARAPDTASRLAALDELGEMELSLADEFVHAGVAAMPHDYKDDKGMADAFVHALRGAVAPRIESARKAFKKCQSLARASKVSTPAATRCSDRLASMPQPLPVQPRPPVAAATPSLPVPKRPLIASTQKTPCVFSGTLQSFGQLDDSHGKPVAFLQSPPGVEVSALELPTEKAKPMRISLSWPIVFSGTLSARSLPLVTRQRIDLVEKHIWVDSDTLVTAFHPDHSHAVVYRDFRDGHAASRTEPRELSRRIDCSRLALDQRDPSESDSKPHDKPEYLGGLVALYAAPGKRRIGTVDLPQHVASRVTLVERHGDFARVQGRDGFSFDAWVKESAVESPGVLGMLSSSAGHYTHTARAAVPLRLRPEALAPIIAQLAPGAYVQVGPIDSGFVPLRVSGVFAHNRARAFYIEARDLPKLAPAGAAH